MQLSHLAIVGLLITSAMFAGCAGDDNGEGDASPSPSPGTNQTAPKARDITIIAYDTPSSPTQTTVMRFTPNNPTGKVNETINLIFRVAAMQRGAHNLRIPELGITTQLDGVAVGAQKNITITLTKDGTFRFFCNINAGATMHSSHDSLGMNGNFAVSKA